MCWNDNNLQNSLNWACVMPVQVSQECLYILYQTFSPGLLLAHLWVRIACLVFIYSNRCMLQLMLESDEINLAFSGLMAVSQPHVIDVQAFSVSVPLVSLDACTYWITVSHDFGLTKSSASSVPFSMLAKRGYINLYSDYCGSNCELVLPAQAIMIGLGMENHRFQLVC